MAVTDSDEEGGADSFIAGGVVIVLALLFVVGLILLWREGPGGPPRDAIQARLKNGVITPEQAAEAERLLNLSEEGSPDSIDAALNDLYTRRSSGEITEDQFWRARDAIGR